MTRKQLPNGDPLEQKIELVLDPGAFISYDASFSFVSDLDEVATGIARLLGSDPTRAVTLYETFLAACYMKIEELDDSSGAFGQFVDGLYCGWIEARQAAGADPDETASQLLNWMDQDEYGFCDRLEKDAVRVFDKANLAAFAKQVRAQFDVAANETAKTDDRHRDHCGDLRRQWGEVLRTLYAAQQDVAAYVALAEQTGLTAKDCHAIATLLVSRRKPAQALSWVERGFEIDRQSPQGAMASGVLARLKRDLLSRLGRGDEALDAAWSDYRKHPSAYTYDDLMRYVPKAQRQQWHDKAIGAAMGADLHAVMDLLLKTRELERLAERLRRTGDIDLEDLSHYATEPAATELEEPYPDLAARLWRAQGLRIVNAGKSQYYDAALANLEHAKRCFERAGLEGEWSRTVRQVRADHYRKRSFMPGFESLVKGVGPSDEPSFLDRAKARWRTKARGGQ